MKYTINKLQKSPKLRLSLYESMLEDYKKKEIFMDITHLNGATRNSDLLSNGFCYYLNYSPKIKLCLYLGKFKSTLPELYNNKNVSPLDKSVYHFSDNNYRIIALTKAIGEIKQIINK